MWEKEERPERLEMHFCEKDLARICLRYTELVVL